MPRRTRTPTKDVFCRRDQTPCTRAIAAVGGYRSPKRMKRVFRALAQLFPHAQCALRHENAFQLLIATILSAQCTDDRVNKITVELFKKYRNPRDFAAADQRMLEQDIRSSGFFRNKAKNIIGTSSRIIREFEGKVPRSLDQLLTLPGVARKTANVVLGTAYGIPSGIVVDTHVFRVATRRLKLSGKKIAEKVEEDLVEIVPQDRWIRFSHQMTWFGREICLARKPRCAECLLEPICDSLDKTV